MFEVTSTNGVNFCYFKDEPFIPNDSTHLIFKVQAKNDVVLDGIQNSLVTIYKFKILQNFLSLPRLKGMHNLVHSNF